MLKAKKLIILFISQLKKMKMKNFKQRLKGGLIGGAMATIFYTVLSGNYTFTNISKWIIVGFLVSFFIGFLFPFLLGKISPKLKK